MSDILCRPGQQILIDGLPQTSQNAGSRFQIDTSGPQLVEMSDFRKSVRTDARLFAHKASVKKRGRDSFAVRNKSTFCDV
jgi:hypothetical protein